MQNTFTIFYHYIFRISAIVCVICTFLFQELGAQTLAFPEAEGFGRFAEGARGVDAPEVYVVTNLNDSGPGSFRDAVSQSGRFVVFAVGGIIKLNADVNVAANTTIAGQTAPGDGIVLFNKRVTFSGSSNTIARYLRIRLGATDNSGKDASGISNGENMIFDHMSVTWGMDEVFSINWDGKGPSLDGITIQNSIIGQGLHRSNHSAGGLIQTPDEGGSVSLIKNLYISNKTRNPKVKGINEFVNNVVYNYGNYGNEMGHTVSGDGYIMGGSAGVSEVNIINNYFVGGPLTPPDKSTPFSRGTETFNVFGSGNYFDNNKDGTLNGTLVPFDETGYPGIVGAGFKSEPFPYPAAAPTLTAAEAYEYVIANVGANYPRLDQVDGLLIDEVNSRGTEGMYVYRESDLPLSNGGVGDVFNAPAPLDTDSDGIPDAWEDANGLDKANAADAVAASSTAPGYLNIEVYINSLVNTAAPDFMKPPSAIAFTATSTEEPPASEVVITWEDNADDESNYIIERSGDSENFGEIATIAANTTSYTDAAGLIPNTTYYYRIKAVNATEASAYSAPASVKTPPIPTAPEAPSNPSPANAADYVGVNNLSLSWTGSENTVSYKIYFGTDENALALQDEVSTPTFSLVTSLTENTTYFWRVDAINEKGTTTGNVWSFTTQQSYEAGKIGHWSFNETAEDGNQITDSSAYENHGILGLDDDNQGIRVPGKFDNALDFSTASNDMYVVSIPDEGHLYLNKQSFSISFWMKADPALLPPDNNSSAYLLCKGSITKDASTGATGKRFDIEFKNKQLRFAIDDANDAGGGGKDELQADGVPFFSGEWEHVVVIRDDINKKLKLYLNGTMVKETNITKANGGIGEESALILGNIGELEFLTSTNTPAPYKGMLDELKMFNYSLSTDDIAALMNGEDPGEPVISLKPENPSPENEATGIDPKDAVLEWTGGADSYDLYMGATAEELSLVAEGLTELSYTLADLEGETTYFWRVDAKEGAETTIGDVWSFTTGILIEDALVGHWSLNATSGTAVTDETTFQNHGQLVDLTEAGWITGGKYENAYDFSGGTTTSHISVPNQDHLFFDQSSFSISFWMKADPEYPTAQAYLINKGEFGVNAETGGTGQWFGIELKDGLMRFAVDDNSTKTELQISDNSPFFTGDWVHVVAVRDTESDKLILYRDGEMVGEKGDGTNNPIGSSLPLVIGNSSIKNAPFRGMMDDVKLFNYSLSPDEVGALFAGVEVLAKASNPQPADATEGVNPDEVNFSWTGNADTYNLYVGTTEENMQLKAEGISEKSYTATGLSKDNTYLWRVDALRGEETVTGNVWSFSTPDGDLVGHWSLNASSGTTVTDETPYANHGQLVDLTEAGWTEGKEENAFDFSGGSTASRIQVPHQEQLLFEQNSFTISFWMKANPDYPDAQAYLINKGEFGVNAETGGTGQWFGIEIKDGALRFAVDDNSTKTELKISDNSAFLTGEWVHVVAVRNTENDKLLLYRDGELVGEKGDGTNQSIATPLPLVIGNSSIHTAPFTGMMDEVKVFNYSLTHPEILSLKTGIPVEFIVTNPSPVNEATDVNPGEVMFGWTGNAETYNFYIGTDAENLVLEAEGLSDTNYSMTSLSHETTYYWRIDPVVGSEHRMGDVWSFTTREPVDKPSEPSPTHEATNIEPVDLMLSWTGNAEVYNLYFGEDPQDLALIGEGLSEASFATTGLAYASDYYWRVDATTGLETSTGDTWSFTTRESIGQTSAPTPAHEATNIDTDPEAVVLNWSGNSTYYDLYMGTDPENMELKVFGISETSYTVFWELEPGTQYYWRVDARAGEELKEGIVWSFTTHSVSGLDDSNGEAFTSFPNPFSDILNIRFTVNKPEKVNISLYNNSSQLVETLFDGTVKSGFHDYRYGFNTGKLQHISQGVYFIVIQTADQKRVKKLVYLK